MREVTSSEIRVLMNEMGHLDGSFLKKFYDLGEGAFRFGFYKESRNTHVYCKLLSTINETKFAETANEATTFAIGVRKRIEDQKVAKIYQQNFDRIVVIEILARDDTYKLVIEMFSKGNMILLDSKGIVAMCYKSISYRDRDIRPHAKYIFPESNSVDVEKIDKKRVMEILEAAKASDGRLIANLSKSINVGPIYLEDIITGCGMDPKGKLETEAQADALANAILEFSKEIKNPRPIAYFKDGELIDYAITPIKKYEGFEKKEYGSLSALLDEIYTEGRFSQKDTAREKKIEEINANIKKQKELSEQLKVDSGDYKVIANKVFANMNMINSMIMYLRENKRATIEDLRRAFADIKIKEIDLKNKIVKIELE